MPRRDAVRLSALGVATPRRTASAHCARALSGWLVAGLACAPPIAATPYPTAEPPAESEADDGRVPARPPHTAQFGDRQIALQPFVSGFPYGEFSVDLKNEVMFYLEQGSRYTLRRLELGDLNSTSVDLGQGTPVTDIDWSQRGLRAVKYEASRRRTWLLADTGNDERWNLFALEPGTPSLQPVTDTDYIYGFGLSDDESKLAYIGRAGARAPFETCVFVRDLAAGTEKKLICDEPALRFTWGTVQFSPDNRELYVVAQRDGDRARGQIVRLNVAKPDDRPRFVTDREIPRFSPWLLEGWHRGEELVFVADDDGYRNVYVYSRKLDKVRQITRFVDDVTTAALVDEGVFVAHGTPKQTSIEVVDLASGSSAVRASVAGDVTVLDAHGEHIMWAREAPDLVFEAVLSRASRAEQAVELRNRKVVALDEKLVGEVVQCRAEAVEIPTFDVDAATGKQRLLHAFVLHPQSPLPSEETLVMVRAFYGGANEYNRDDQVLCAAGITLISPAVRGSWGFGRSFYALNDKDLGGDEIVDLFHVARWAERRFEVQADRVGVYGRSHGGYATMRAMTFPPETNDRQDSYPFGFGLAEAGFSDIEAFYRASNIPDWVRLEAGDPATPEGKAKLAERSPINHVDRLSAPIFLLHGANDQRVPVAGSRAFAKRAEAAGKRVVYVEVEGQGHHIEGLDRIAAAFQARFDFLASYRNLR
ncbi:MAG: S9 family peptidase [Myxococcales bacterium FL481]|nr:MAG: S9 family peptidase [Myxococcales bacterium FL481]